MVAAIVCREMKWTWQEYYGQPEHFIKIVLHMLKSEAKERNRQQKS